MAREPSGWPSSAALMPDPALAGAVLAGTALAGTVLAGPALAGAVLAGAVPAGTALAGTALADRGPVGPVASRSALVTAPAAALAAALAVALAATGRNRPLRRRQVSPPMVATASAATLTISPAVTPYRAPAGVRAFPGQVAGTVTSTWPPDVISKLRTCAAATDTEAG